MRARPRVPACPLGSLPWPPRRAGKAQFRRRRSSPDDAVRGVGFALAPIRKRRRQDARASAPPQRAAVDPLEFFKDFRTPRTEDRPCRQHNNPARAGHWARIGRSVTGTAGSPASVHKGTAVDVEFAEPTPHPIQGQLLRLSERREVAIYLRDGALWVADFIDGFGTLADAATWFRFSCASSASWHLRRRMALESAMPLSSALIARSPRVHERRPLPGASV